jgi:hypothetical protein
MSATITVSGKFTGYTHTLTVDVEEQDSVANTTTVSYSYGLHREVAKSHGSVLVGDIPFHAILNGVDNVNSPTVDFSSVTDYEVISGEQTINNNIDGTLSFTVELKTAGKSTSSYLKPADKTATFTVDPIDRTTTFSVSPLPVVGGAPFTVALNPLDPSFTHTVTMTDSSGNVTTVATGVTTSASGTAPALPVGATADAASIDVATISAGTTLGVQTQDLLIWSAADNPPLDVNPTFDFRFRNMIRTGNTIQPNEIIPYTTANFTDTLSDTATCSITTQDAIYPNDLDKAVVLAEVYIGGAWVNTGLLFSLSRVENDFVDVQGQVTYSGTAYIDFLLGKLVLSKKSKDSGVTPGSMISSHIAGGQTTSRGWGPLVTYDFSSTKTSAKTKWYGHTSQTNEAGTPVMQMIQALVTNTNAEYRPDYNATTGKAVLHLNNPGYGYDWTLPTSKTIVNFKTQGVSKVVTTAPVQKDYSGMLTRVTVTGKTTNKKTKVRNPKTGRLDTETHSSTLTRTKNRKDLINPLYGALEARVDASGVSSATELTKIGDDTITQGNIPVQSRQFTYEVDSQDIPASLYPYRIFKPGDWVWVPGDNGVLERDRIQQVVVSRDADTTTVQITTGDLIPTGAAALYRYVKRSSANAIPGGTLVSTPQDSGVISPSSVQNIVPTMTSTFDSRGIAVSAVALSWDEVTTDDDGNDLSVPSYQVLQRADFTQDWSVVATAQINSVQLPTVAPGVSMDFAVLPVADDGTIGNPDDFITVTTPDPDAMVGSPDTPTLTADSLGNLSITWDGLMSGIVPTSEFSYVRAEISADGSTGWSPAGSQLQVAGSTVVQDVGAGTWYIHLVPVDNLGRSGTPSSVASQLVTPIVPDTRSPNSPATASGTSSAGWSGSEPFANVALTWAAVTTATDGSAMTLNGYEVWGKVHTDTAYIFLTSVRNSATTATISDVSPIGGTWDFRIRAIGANAVPGSFSPVVTQVIATPSLTLDPPTAPDLDTARGLLVVSWDGNLYNAATSTAYAAPPYLAKVDIMVSIDAGTTYTRMGSFTSGSRTTTIAGIGIGADAFVELIASDRVGNTTAASASDDITIIGIDGADLIVNTIDGNDIKVGTLEVDRVSPSFGDNLDLSANGDVTIVAGAAATAQATADANTIGLAAQKQAYNFSPSGLTITQPGVGTASVTINNSEIDFYQGLIKAAYLSASVFFAPKFNGSELALTSHIISDDPAGAGTIIKRA